MEKKIVRRETSKVLLIGLALAVTRFLPTQTYNDLLYSLIKTINKECLPMYAHDLIEVIKFSPQVSKQYKSINEEASAIVKKYPLFSHFHDYVSLQVRYYRKKYEMN